MTLIELIDQGEKQEKLVVEGGLYTVALELRMQDIDDRGKQAGSVILGRSKVYELKCMLDGWLNCDGRLMSAISGKIVR